MPEIKYTTKGQKVVVIGSLNSQEKIVQEIFVIDGSEVPSGEHFVVKSLHDAPAVSWEEKRTKEIKDQYERTNTEYRRSTEEMQKKWKDMQVKLREKLVWAAEFLKIASPDHFQTLVDYITGDIKWVVLSRYEPEIVPFEDFEKNYEERLRLISVYGASKGNVTYGKGQYYDYSGSSGDHFKPFVKYEDAFEYFKKTVLSKTITDKMIELAQKNGFDFPEDKKKEHYSARLKSLTENITKYQGDIKNWQATIDKITPLLKPTE